MSSVLRAPQLLSSYRTKPIQRTQAAEFYVLPAAPLLSARDQLLRSKASSGAEYKLWQYIALVGLVLALHSAVFIVYVQRDTSSLAPKPAHKVEIEFVKPVIVPPMAVIAPKPPPKIVKRELAPPKPAPALRTQPAAKIIAPETITVPENASAVKSTVPIIAAVAETPPAKVEETVTEASANSAYLNNPAPDYPAFAQRQGWEGKVLLHVHVLASGKADKVELKQSSGRKTLDESAINAVRNWTFIPSKRGNSGIDGWATVPIEFKLSK